MRFFTLDDPLLRSAFRGSVGNGDKVGVFWKALSGAQIRLDALNVSYFSGKRLHDFVWTAATVPLVNERVRDVLSRHQLLGWSSYQIRLFDQDDHFVPGYSGLAVTGRCASISFNKRAEAVVYKVNRNGLPIPYFKGLCFDLGAWDGSDFFMGADEKNGWIVVSERVESLFKTQKITNCRFTPVEEVELIAQKSDIQPTVN